MKPEIVSALQSLKGWKRLGIQPAITASELARVLSEEEISKKQEQLSQFNIS